MSESSKIDEIIKKYTITNDDNKLTGDILSRWEAFSGRESGVPTRLDMDSYFDVEGVMTPYVRVWFLGLDNKWIEVGGEEEENYYSQNNFFESMTIEDTGFLSLTLNLIDRTSYRIQSLLELACYNQSKNADENIKNSQETKGFLKAAAKEEGEEGLSLSLFKEKNISNNNLKIRFGYSDVTNINNGDEAKKFFEAVGRESDANSRWVENSSPYVSTEITTGGTKRTVAIGTANFTHNTQTQPKSYEEEFYIIGFSTQISTTGIKYSIKAIRAANLFLNSYKLVQNYSKLVGTPREIMAYFMRTFNEREDTNLKDIRGMFKLSIEEKYNHIEGGNYFFIKEGAITISKEGVLDINIEKMVSTARKMLEKIIEVQLSGDFAEGEKYVTENFVWTDEMETLAQNIKKVSKTLNGRVESSLADRLLEEG